ncbi:MAG: hypothetical protein PUB67_06470 [Clostridiales bacterium]|nr:hypothetical protein [Clostridiales bacterium]
MGFLKIVAGILAFALVTVIIYMWGLSKQMRSEQDLNNMIMAKGTGIVLKYLKSHDYITKKDIINLFKDGIKVKLFYSRNVAAVNDTDKFSESVIEYMIKTGQLVKEGNRYRLGK